MKFVVVGILFALFSVQALADPYCGNTRLLQNRQQKATTKIASQSTTNCNAEAYYDTADVRERKTSHFQIFYVLSGVHATNEEFIDSLSNALENAWTYYIQKMGYTKPVNASVSWLYQKKISNLYPVEVGEVNAIRDNGSLFGGFCGECIAVTLPSENDTKSSEIFIDNDFLYSNILSQQIPTKSDSSCTYYKADNPMKNTITGKDYSITFGELIRATAFHELYHAIQFMYVPPSVWQDTYWHEASAAAQEEIGAPDVNDYWRYLPAFFDLAGRSFNSISNYGICLWDIYNENVFGKEIAKKLWTRYSTMQDSSFEKVFAAELKAQKINPDSSFADFAKRLFFSGQRASFADSTVPFTSDAFLWNFAPKQFAATTEELSLDAPAIAYYRLTTDSIPDLIHFKGNANVALYGEKQKLAFYSLDSMTFDNLIPAISHSKYATLILSRLRDDEQKKIIVDSLPMRSYPNPWRGETPLCFTNLPEAKNYVEIRTRVGKLVNRFEYSGIRFCVDANDLKEHLAPGLYYFRAGNKSKLKPFLVVY